MIPSATLQHSHSSILHILKRDDASHAATPGVDGTNHGLLATVAVAFSLTMVGLTLIVRMMVRWPLARMFGRDDGANLASIILCIAQSTVLLLAVHEGFGRRGPALVTVNVPKAEKLLLASDILYTVTLYSSKLTVAFLFERIAGFKEYRKYTVAFGVAPILCGIISILLIAVGPAPDRPYEHASDRVCNCPLNVLPVDTNDIDGQFSRWVAIEVLSMAIDVAIMAFPVFLLWELRMQRSKKFWITFGFAARLPLIAIASVRLWALNIALHRSDFLFAYINPVIVAQVEQAYAIICATIPCLGIVLLGANSGMLPVMATIASSIHETVVTVHGQHPQHHKFPHPHDLPNNTSSSNGNNPVNSKGSSIPRITESRVKSMLMRDDIFELTDRSRGQTTATATCVEKKSVEDASAGSRDSRQAILVRQTIDVQYETTVPSQELDEKSAAVGADAQTPPPAS